MKPPPLPNYKKPVPKPERGASALKPPIAPPERRPSTSRVRTPLKTDRKPLREPRFIQGPNVKAMQQEARRVELEMVKDKTALDKKIEELKPKIEQMKEFQQLSPAAKLGVDEKVIILEAHFSKGIGVAAIAKVLNRNHSVIARFLKAYKSTAPIAKRVLENSAERLAKRVVNNANVQESMEVLDRLDVLPRKPREASGSSGPRFNIFVGGGSTVSRAEIPDAVDVTPHVPEIPE